MGKVKWGGLWGGVPLSGPYLEGGGRHPPIWGSPSRGGGQMWGGGGSKGGVKSGVREGLIAGVKWGGGRTSPLPPQVSPSMAGVVPVAP